MSPGELNAWKEIAGYLGVTERTAQLWERKHALPIHRIGGRVVAYESELDRWKETQSNAKPNGQSSSRRYLWRALLALTAAGIATAAWLRVAHPKPIMGAYHFESQFLVVTDSSGKELWRRSFAQSFETSHYQIPNTRARFYDLDGDGRPEFLFGHIPKEFETVPSTLYCFGDDGRELWHFQPGRSLNRPHLKQAVYFTSKIAITRDGPQGPLRILLLSPHVPYYPTQVSMLDVNGKLLSEYWHSGHLDLMELADLDGDGRDEVILAGVNNSRHQATLVVLDLKQVNGASSENVERLQIEGFPHANERARIFFPRSCINRKFENYNWVQSLTFSPEGLRVQVTEAREKPVHVYFHFDRDLKLTKTVADDAWRVWHRELSASKVLDHAWKAEEEAALSRVDYFTH